MVRRLGSRNGGIRRLLRPPFGRLRFVRIAFRQQGFELRQVAERGEVGVLLHVGEIFPAGRDRLTQRGQGVGDVLLPRGGLLDGER